MGGRRERRVASLAATRFDIFVTADQNLQFQQNLSALPLTVAVLVAPNNKLQSLLGPAAELLSRIESLSPRSLVRLSVRDDGWANHAFNRTRRYGPSTWRTSVAAGRL